jgi:hypothetical protein
MINDESPRIKEESAMLAKQGGQKDVKTRYNAGMTVQTFRDLLTRRPFKPFRIVMSSGQAYEIPHPEMAMLTQSDLVVGIKETRHGVPKEFRICSLLHITSVEPVASSPK